MRTPFVRPFFAKFFYALAILGGGLATLLLFAEFAGFYRLLGGKMASTLAVYGVLVTFYLWACALTLAAVGYVIELLAKIEWNTRPKTDEMGKMSHIRRGEVSAAIVGSSNFTTRGLGLAATNNNVELNLVVRDDRDRDDLKAWFEELWNDTSRVEDVKPQVLD